MLNFKLCQSPVLREKGNLNIAKIIKVFLTKSLYLICFKLHDLAINDSNQ